MCGVNCSIGPATILLSVKQKQHFTIAISLQRKILEEFQ